ncbi:MAG: hypothetical protein ACPLRH_01860, partial [Desulfotomaculales bacterium]
KSQTKPFFFLFFPGDDYNLDIMLYNYWTAFMEACFQASFLPANRFCRLASSCPKRGQFLKGKRGIGAGSSNSHMNKVIFSKQS